MADPVNRRGNDSKNDDANRLNRNLRSMASGCESTAPPSCPGGEWRPRVAVALRSASLL